MKYMWRVTKYNPVNRDDVGIYLLDEWTSFSDIGKSYQGVKLTISEYVKFEKLYIDAILQFMSCNEVENLIITGLEKYDDENVDKVINYIREGMILDKEQIKIVAQHVLREKLWCKLILDEVFYVHFGYDYIMYIGSNKKCQKVIKEIECNKMFVEPFKSPYLEEYE